METAPFRLRGNVGKTAPILLLALLCSTAHALGPCYLQSSGFSSDSSNGRAEIRRDDGPLEEYLPASNPEVCSGATDLIPIGFFQEKAFIEYFVGGSQSVRLLSDGSCNGGLVVADRETLETENCQRPDCPHPDAVGCDGVDPVVRRALTSFVVLMWSLGILVAFNMVVIIILLMNKNKIEQPQRYPHFSVAHREKVIASVKHSPQSVHQSRAAPAPAAPAPAEVERSSAPVLPSSTADLGIGPVSSRTRVGISVLLCFLVFLGHVPLALALEGVWAWISAVSWMAALVLGAMAFMGQNTFDNWHLAVICGGVISLTGNMLGLYQWMQVVERGHDICLSGCDNVEDDPLFYDNCIAICGDLGDAFIGPIINVAALFIASLVLFLETRRAAAGNGKVITYGYQFPTVTGFKDVARPTGGSHGSRRGGSGRRPPGDGGSYGSRGSRR